MNIPKHLSFKIKPCRFSNICFALLCIDLFIKHCSSLHYFAYIALFFFKAAMTSEHAKGWCALPYTYAQSDFLCMFSSRPLKQLIGRVGRGRGRVGRGGLCFVLFFSRLLAHIISTFDMPVPYTAPILADSLSPTKLCNRSCTLYAGDSPCSRYEASNVGTRLLLKCRILLIDSVSSCQSSSSNCVGPSATPGKLFAMREPLAIPAFLCQSLAF